MATKKGAGGEPQEYDTSTGQYGSGSTFRQNTPHHVIVHAGETELKNQRLLSEFESISSEAERLEFFQRLETEWDIVDKDVSDKLSQSGLDESQLKAIDWYLHNLPEGEAKTWKNAIKSAKISFSNLGDKSSYFDEKKNEIVFNSERFTDFETVFHEIGHYIDANNKKRLTVWQGTFYEYSTTKPTKYISALMDDMTKGMDIATLCDVIGAQTNEDGSWFGDAGKASLSLNRYLSSLKKDGKIEEISVSLLSDIIDGMSNGALEGTTRYFGSHPKEYWMRSETSENAGPVADECWANYCALRAIKADNAISELSRIFPSLHRHLEKAYEGVFG